MVAAFIKRCRSAACKSARARRAVNYREPLVLADLIARLEPELKKSDTALAGWILHYAAGAAFMLVYHIIWKRQIVKPSVVSGMR